MSPAEAAPAAAATATAYGANTSLAGTPVVNKAGLATATLPPGEDDGPNALVLVPAEPVAVSGTAVGVANAHVASDVPSALEQVAQAVPGPYNARGVGLIEDLDVLLGVAPAPGTPDLRQSVVSASLVRGEAVGVCRAGKATYSANSEIVDLNVGGTDVPLNAPISGLIDTINMTLEPLAQVANIKRNEVVVTADGATVNALHVTILSATGGAPVLDLIVGRAEVRGLQCAPVAQCSDTQDNDGDGAIDSQDPGCINNGVFDPNDNDERNVLVTSTQPPRTSASGGELARTGGDLSSTAPVALGLSVLGFAILALRRRILS